MMQNKLPVGILKVDYNIALMGEDIIDSPQKAVAAIASQLSGLTTEYGIMLCLDTANRPICIGFLGTGDEKTIDFSPKEIVQFSLLTNASGIILFHNHPANGKKFSSLRPSQEDVKMTREISERIQLFGIHLQDHIIVNYTWEEDKCTPAFYSMRSKRAYKNLFNSQITPMSNYIPEEEVFTGKEVFDETIQEERHEHITKPNETSYRERPSIPSL